ncbi:class I SAM-dependent methyltransferase [Pelatocladus sp. BLCC-F211]|uniref:class I SAM-dependent methyltransferase n=1 Tax=Pelatocladus sp. BLCC-F211 TaxID=3342752 RepID=UPI0035B8A274
MDSHPTLCAAIRDRIANSPDQRITFATYMDMALYHPDYGYYSTEAVNIGKQGDFFTSVHLGPDFGELLAEQFVQMWEILGQPAAFSLVEMGAGQGHLALDILNYLKLRYPNFFAALKYIIVEKSPILRQEQQQRLQGFTVEIKSSLEEILSNSIIGCFFSNELVDALPVHQFILEQGQLREIYVTLQPESIETRFIASAQSQESIVNSQRPPTPFTEVIAEPSTPRLAEYFDLVGIQFLENVYPEGYRSEVNLAALDWLGVVADRLQRGYVLTIDYGYPASRYYNPRRSQGTLQCYWHHQRHNNPYINIGQQDITAHVDFTALERWGERCGLAKVGWTQQELFLMALGLGDRMVSLSHTNQPISDLLRRRDALRQLLDPYGLGGFGVLAQSKGLKETETFLTLKGFTVPQLPTSN